MTLVNWFMIIIMKIIIIIMIIIKVVNNNKNKMYVINCKRAGVGFLFVFIVMRFHNIQDKIIIYIHITFFFSYLYTYVVHISLRFFSPLRVSNYTTTSHIKHTFITIHSVNVRCKLLCYAVPL